MIGQELKTLGLSQKAILAFFFPLISALVAAAILWITSGVWDDTALKVALTGTGASFISLLGAYMGKPGTVVASDGGPVSGTNEMVPEWPGSPAPDAPQPLPSDTPALPTADASDVPPEVIP